MFSRFTTIWHVFDVVLKIAKEKYDIDEVRYALYNTESGNMDQIGQHPFWQVWYREFPIAFPEQVMLVCMNEKGTENHVSASIDNDTRVSIHTGGQYFIIDFGSSICYIDYIGEMTFASVDEVVQLILANIRSDGDRSSTEEIQSDWSWTEAIDDDVSMGDDNMSV
jgi:hypothetical protein